MVVVVRMSCCSSHWSFPWRLADLSVIEPHNLSFQRYLRLGEEVPLPFAPSPLAFIAHCLCLCLMYWLKDVELSLQRMKSLLSNSKSFFLARLLCTLNIKCSYIYADLLLCTWQNRSGKYSRNVYSQLFGAWLIIDHQTGCQIRYGICKNSRSVFMITKLSEF